MQTVCIYMHLVLDLQQTFRNSKLCIIKDSCKMTVATAVISQESLIMEIYCFMVHGKLKDKLICKKKLMKKSRKTLSGRLFGFAYKIF